jgi:hypothetical protein
MTSKNIQPFESLKGISGGAPSFTIGGLLTTSGNDATLFLYASGAIIIATLLYSSFVLPESLPEEKRKRLQLQQSSPITAPDSSDQRTCRSILEWLEVLLKPLKELIPQLNPITRQLNFRLLYCIPHTLIANIGDEYAIVLVIIFITTRHGYTPADVSAHM